MFVQRLIGEEVHFPTCLSSLAQQHLPILNIKCVKYSHLLWLQILTNSQRKLFIGDVFHVNDNYIFTSNKQIQEHVSYNILILSSLTKTRESPFLLKPSLNVSRWIKLWRGRRVEKMEGCRSGKIEMEGWKERTVERAKQGRLWKNHSNLTKPESAERSIYFPSSLFSTSFHTSCSLIFTVKATYFHLVHVFPQLVS